MHVFFKAVSKNKNKKQFLYCLIKPLLIQYSKSLKIGRRNWEKRKNRAKKSRERRQSREQKKGEGERKSDGSMTWSRRLESRRTHATVRTWSGEDSETVQCSQPDCQSASWQPQHIPAHITERFLYARHCTVFIYNNFSQGIQITLGLVCYYYPILQLGTLRLR